MSRRFLHVVFNTALIALHLALSGCDKPAPLAAPIRPVRVMKVADVQQLTGRPFPGQAVANEEVDLALRVGGVLAELPVKAGDTVKKDALLARLDPRDYEVKVLTAEGDLAAVDAAVKNAQLEYDRTKKLFDDKAAEQRELDRRKAALELHQGQKKSIEARLEAANDDLKYTKLSAPFDGLIATTYADNFQTVKAQERVLRLLDLSKIKFQIDLPEKAMPMLKYVKEVNVTIQPFPGRTFPAKVHEVAHEASRSTRTYRVTLLLDQPDDVKILPGMTGDARGKADFPAGAAKEGVEVLPTALFELEGKSYVWLLEGTKVKRQAVEVERMSGNTVLVKGLTPGQTVVTAGVHFLKEGQEVSVLDDGAAGAEKATPVSAASGGAVK
jgi:RND family efflux transporter MFP subunit